MVKRPDYSVPALEKGLDIMEALAAAAVPQSLAELATRLSRSSSELFRMLNCLERRGYLMRDGSTGKFALSLKLFTLAHAHALTDKLLRAARRPMQAFTEQHRESCHLSVLERGKLLVVAQQQSPDPVRISIEVGATFDAEHTASGRLLLAYLAAADRREWHAAQHASAKASKLLERRLAEIRKSGVSLAESETVAGVRDLAVLVGNPAGGGAATAALAVTRLVRRGERAGDAGLLAAMRATAQEITQTLGVL